MRHEANPFSTGNVARTFQLTNNAQLFRNIMARRLCRENVNI